MIVECTGCKEQYDDNTTKTCPVCGSIEKTIYIRVEHTIGVKMKVPGLNIKGKKIKLGNRKRYSFEHEWNSEKRQANGSIVKYERKIDRVGNRYYEHVEDCKTGEVRHHCDEPLSDHTGHGSDKKNKK